MDDATLDALDFTPAAIICMAPTCGDAATWLIRTRCRTCGDHRVHYTCGTHRRVLTLHAGRGKAVHLPCPNAPTYGGVLGLLLVQPLDDALAWPGTT